MAIDDVGPKEGYNLAINKIVDKAGFVRIGLKFILDEAPSECWSYNTEIFQIVFWGTVAFLTSSYEKYDL